MRRFAALIVAVALVSGCAHTGDKTAKSSAAGAALGAGLGAIVGNQTGDAGAGVAIGAGIGALAGALVGDQIDRQEDENDQLREQLTRQEAQIEENRRLIKELRRRGADVRSTDRGVVVNLPDVLFEFNEARLTPEARRTIAEIASVLRDIPNRSISVEGHTDSIGTMDYNYRLSQRRARSAANELVRDGISSRRVTTKGFGEGRPVSTNNTEAGRQRNRRVEIIIEND